MSARDLHYLAVGAYRPTCGTTDLLARVTREANATTCVACLAIISPPTKKRENGHPWSCICAVCTTDRMRLWT